MLAFQGQYNFSNVNNIGLLFLTNRAIQGRQDQMIINNFITVLKNKYVTLSFSHSGNYYALAVYIDLNTDFISITA